MPTLTIPTMHKGQIEAWQSRGRFSVVRCGRRWGKTDYGKILACDGAAKGRSIGWFAPSYKIMSEAYEQIIDTLAPIKSRSNKTDGVIRTISGGRIDFWSLENEQAGRSRKYHHAIIDEAAFAKNSTMENIWDKAIKPTLLDFKGRATVFSTPNGIDEDNWFYRICTQKEFGWSEYHAPSHSNPYLPAEELAKLEADNHPMVYRQEYLAEFVDWSGCAFFDTGNMLVDGTAVSIDNPVDYVYAVIDSATKTGKEHDGTAVIYCAISKYYGHPLVILDWDIVQIEGALLETWLPTVYENLESMAVMYRARLGSAGAFIEDKASGMILIQQAHRRGWAANAIDSKLTSVGKDERAISVSGYVYRGMVKLCQTAHDRLVTYKGASRNHLLSQIAGFRPGDKEAYKRADDLLDCFCYAVAIGLGDSKGF